MFIEATITWVPLGISGYIWLNTKNCVKNSINIMLVKFRSFMYIVYQSILCSV